MVRLCCSLTGLSGSGSHRGRSRGSAGGTLCDGTEVWGSPSWESLRETKRECWMNLEYSSQV